ncbi:MAG: hypothetical protein AB7U75_17795 [Hyphomicrobiaceae bacterium]
MRRQTVISLLVVLALVLGVALKVGRYAERGDEASLTAAAHVVRIMAAHGWSETDLPTGNTGSVYEQKAFQKSGCTKPVFVAILGGNAEGAWFFRLQHGGDAAFVQGNVVDHPSGMQRQLIGMVRGIGRILGLASKEPLPVLAIAPAPGASALPCNGPPAEAWL